MRNIALSQLIKALSKSCLYYWDNFSELSELCLVSAITTTSLRIQSWRCEEENELREERSKKCWKRKVKWTKVTSLSLLFCLI